MKKINKRKIAGILGSIAGFTLIGKTGRNGVIQKREELFCALFACVSGKGKVAGEKQIINIASDGVTAIDGIKGDLSSQIKQTLQRNIASACNLYLELWNVPAEIKVTTKAIEYNMVDRDRKNRLNLLKRFHTAMMAMAGEISLYDAVAFHLAQTEGTKETSKMKDEKVAIKARQEATEKNLFNAALDLAANG